MYLPQPWFDMPTSKYPSTSVGSIPFQTSERKKEKKRLLMHCSLLLAVNNSKAIQYPIHDKGSSHNILITVKM